MHRRHGGLDSLLEETWGENLGRNVTVSIAIDFRAALPKSHHRTRTKRGGRLMNALFSLLASAAALTPTSVHGNWIFRPPSTSAPAKGIVFFLGGAFVGAAPQLAYNKFCSSLANEGYVVLATPYELSFDYVELCDSILSTADPAFEQLLREYPEDLPLFGIGHSCGALLHVLLSSIYRGAGGALADCERQANVLISFNNKPANEAIPFFGELVAPAAASVLRFDRDPLLRPWRAAVDETRRRLATVSGAAGASVSASAATLAAQLLPVLEQIEPILREIDGGRVEFAPSPVEVERVASQLYDCRATLVVRFEGDSLDESPPLPSVLQAGGGDVKLTSLAGTHLTPLSPDAATLPLPLPLPFAASAALGGARADEFQCASECVLGFLQEQAQARRPMGPPRPEVNGQSVAPEAQNAAAAAAAPSGAQRVNDIGQ